MPNPRPFKKKNKEYWILFFEQIFLWVLFWVNPHFWGLFLSDLTLLSTFWELVRTLFFLVKYPFSFTCLSFFSLLLFVCFLREFTFLITFLSFFTFLVLFFSSVTFLVLFEYFFYFWSSRPYMILKYILLYLGKQDQGQGCIN